MPNEFKVGDRVRVYAKFNVGDRVRVYATLNGNRAETAGELMRKRQDEMWFVKLDGRRGQIIAHPKQCRRLIKRPKRRIWIYATSFDDIQTVGQDETSFECLREHPMVFTRRASDNMEKMIEFVEVKRK
jgi:hypothetical protein